MKSGKVILGGDPQEILMGKENLKEIDCIIGKSGSDGEHVMPQVGLSFPDGEDKWRFGIQPSISWGSPFIMIFWFGSNPLETQEKCV